MPFADADQLPEGDLRAAPAPADEDSDRGVQRSSVPVPDRGEMLRAGKTFNHVRSTFWFRISWQTALALGAALLGQRELSFRGGIQRQQCAGRRYATGQHSSACRID